MAVYNSSINSTITSNIHPFTNKPDLENLYSISNSEKLYMHTYTHTHTHTHTQTHTHKHTHIYANAHAYTEGMMLFS